MLRSLLVPLDGSGFSEHSLPLAGKVARLSGASLHLAHVHTPHEPEELLFTTPFQFEHVDMAEYDAQDRDEEERYMFGLADKLSSEGTSTDAKMLEGSEVVGELIDYADRLATDMIVMTSHGNSGIRRLWLGSIADEMIRRTTLPVIVVRPRVERTPQDEALSVRHILVTLDGSDLAEGVLGPASELARATGARMSLVSVVSRPDSFGEESAASGAGYIDDRTEALVKYLEDVAGSLRREGLVVATHVIAGMAPAPTVAHLVDELDVDLVAIATHGRGGIKRTMLGSVADQLIRSASVPILVVRPSPAA